jgi:twitching motility protein PilI
VVDLGLLAASGPVATSRVADRITSESRLVSLHAALGVNVVLWIDRLLGLRNPSMFASVDESTARSHPWFARRLIDHQGHEWQELNLQTLAGDSAFLSIAA